MAANARIQANAINDISGVQALAFGISIQFVKIGHAQRQIGIGKQLDRLGFGKAHVQGIHILLDGPLLQKPGKCMGGFYQVRVVGVGAHNNAGRVQVIIQRFAFPQKLRAEHNVLAAGFLADLLRVANRNGRFDYHNRIGVHLHDQVDDRFHRRGIKVLGLAVIIGRYRNHNKIRIAVGRFPVQRGGQIQVLFRQVFFNVFILNGGLPVVDAVYLAFDQIHRTNRVVLCNQARN